MKKIALLLLSVLVCLSFAQDPEDILVKYDVYGGYGNAVLDAIDGLWPSANVVSYSGNTWSSFTSDLNSDDWDMVICEAHNYYDTTGSAYSAMNTYYNDGGKLFFVEWSMANAGTLLNSMGVTSHSSVPMPPASHYTWETHPITDGVSDWTYGDPGYGTGGRRLTVSDADPVTGWSSSETSGQAGICVANDGSSVVSGYFPSLNTWDAGMIWENILNFMWGATPDDVPPAVSGQDPADGATDVPVDSDIIFHCTDDDSGVDTATIDFTAEYTPALGGSSDNALRIGPSPLDDVSGTLDIDDTDPLDVLCTFTPDSDLPPYTVTCTVAGTLADNAGNTLGDDEVWSFDPVGVKIEPASWGYIKSL